MRNCKQMEQKEDSKEESLPVKQLKEIIKFRAKSAAPVDTMGCSKLGDLSNPKLFRFQTLIALMLSAQTKDMITSQAVENLKTLEGGLTPSSLSKANEETVKNLIRKVSFFNNKAKRIIEVAKICERDYDGDIPDSLDALMKLPGVGLKMATLAMGTAWEKQVGIGVDVHVHRIANRLGWVKTKNPNETEAELQKVFPKELWVPLNEAIVGFGQTICGAKKQKCEECPIRDTCPYGREPSDSYSE
ncbi:DNA glycosylase [Histomonas meleagridis]|uniref:DNA glycosylase n=1 Tax=Histomonas meleagridis TaxID=135588 RepID=UPI003559858A|nr:DNA glycosylase [Histomonas meleagridis]KAH0798914.1 DNA glycosylase [Histomonas meleagridis]